MKRQGIGRRTGEKVNVTLYLEKNEKKMLERISTRFRWNGRVRSGLASAVTFLLRLAFRCSLYHHTETEDQAPLTIDEAVSLGIDFHDGFNVETPKAVARREARTWRKKNPPEPVKRLR